LNTPPDGFLLASITSDTFIALNFLTPENYENPHIIFENSAGFWIAPIIQCNI
jgi:hypothetical protein